MKNSIHSNNWQVGQKVVCIDDSFKTASPKVRAAYTFPHSHGTYTIREVIRRWSSDGQIESCALRFEEIVNEQVWSEKDSAKIEISFYDTSFIDQKTSGGISIKEFFERLEAVLGKPLSESPLDENGNPRGSRTKESEYHIVMTPRSAKKESS
jgi:hypothetical protein